MTQPLPTDLILQAQEWQAARERILEVESDTGYLDTDAIQGSDDDAVEFAQALAGLLPTVHKAEPWVPFSDSGTFCRFCNTLIHSVPGGQGPTWVHTATGAVAAVNPEYRTGPLAPGRTVVGGEATPMRRFKLTGYYGTFEITKVVEARDEDHAYEMTGIATDLAHAGWKVSDVDGEEWEIVEILP